MLQVRPGQPLAEGEVHQRQENVQKDLWTLVAERGWDAMTSFNKRCNIIVGQMPARFVSGTLRLRSNFVAHAKFRGL